jgi:transcriptional regulator with XRE-family HTH domain
VPSKSLPNRPKLLPGTARFLLAKNLLRLRGLKQWSQEELAHQAGLHRTFVTHVELQSRNISLDNLEKLATALGVEAYELLVPASTER